MKKTITTLLLFICLSSAIQAQDAYLGDIKLTAVNFNQRGWMSCEGQLLPINQNAALYSLLGTTYGGDGVTTFALPDLRGRVPVGIGQGNGLSPVVQGEVGGVESNVLTVAQMPSHNHAVNAFVEDGTSSDPTGNYPAGTKLLDKEYASSGTPTTMNSNMISSQGQNSPINNKQPYLGVRYVICVAGLFPTRD
ncbi:phage tail protein [Corallibacter sp.]|uniref:phage tail protein n=1 Tax=Corallibacter sp. TaxID=2038084 RepID=UPI003AB5ABAC